MKSEFLNGTRIPAAEAAADVLARALAGLQAGPAQGETREAFAARLASAARPLALTAEQQAAVLALYGRSAAGGRLGAGQPAAGQPSGRSLSNAGPALAMGRAREIAAALGTSSGPNAAPAARSLSERSGAPAAPPEPAPAARRKELAERGGAAAIPGADGDEAGLSSLPGRALDEGQPPPPPGRDSRPGKEPDEATRLLVNNPDPLQRCRWLFFCRSVDGATYIHPGGFELFLRKPDSISTGADINQGAVGDCFFLAALGAIAERHPEFVRRAIGRNADGTYSMTFFRRRLPWEFWRPDFVPVDVRVDGEFPVVRGSGASRMVLAYAGQGQRGLTRDGQEAHESWAMVAEKAYALYHGGYGAIHGGWPDKALEDLAGRPSRTYSRPTLPPISMLKRWAAEGRAVVASTRSDIQNAGNLVANHAYWVRAWSYSDDTVVLANPWGVPYELKLTDRQFQVMFERVDVNDVTVGSPGNGR